MNTNIKNAAFFTFFGVFYWLIFAYDIEKDRDFWTWLWLLNSILNLMGALRYFIKYDNEK